MATYVYGIVRRPSAKHQWGAGVGKPPSPLRVVTEEDVAALVSDIGEETESEGRALRRDLRAHEEAVRKAMEFGTILPVSFGTVFDDDDQLVEELLAPHAEELADLLDDFEGLVELTLKVDFVEEAVIARLLERDGELLAWRDSARFAGGDEQIAFGQALSEAIEEEAAIRAEGILADLAPLAVDVDVGSPARGTAVLKASFLVDQAKLQEFDAAVEKLVTQASGLLQFDYLGPLPPYSFIHLNLGAPEDAD